MIERANYSERKYLVRYNIFRYLPFYLYPFVINYKYKKKYNKFFSINNPVSLSEKVQWLKLNDNSKKKSDFSDKLYLKEYIFKNCPNLKVAKLYQSALSFDELDFNSFPEQFVIKTNHSWKTATSILSKQHLSNIEKEELNKYYTQALSINYAYWSFYELQYKSIKPMVFVEELIGDYYSLSEYEVYCFNGVPLFLNYRTRDKNFKKFYGLKQHFYSPDWVKMDFSLGMAVDEDIECPKNKDLVLYYSKMLSKDFKFVRVDFIECNEQLYILEMTFTPFSGFFPFSDIKYDIKYGKLLDLN